VAAVVPLKHAELLAELERDDAEAADEGVGQEQATAEPILRCQSAPSQPLIQKG
jgi:hypothetical protein